MSIESSDARKYPSGDRFSLWSALRGQHLGSALYEGTDLVNVVFPKAVLTVYWVDRSVAPGLRRERLMM